MEKTSIDRIYRDVETLTSIQPARNCLNLKSLRVAADYINREFVDAGYEVDEQKWLANRNVYTNVIAAYQPEKPIRLIVGAHYDVCGDQPGADDNASAVAGLLETARLVVANQPNLDYGIDFVAYCLEEPPFFGTELMGSYVHAESLKEVETEVLGMICYEMIGYFSDEPNSQRYPFPGLDKLYPNKGNFIIVVGLHAFQEFHEKFYQKMSHESKIDVQKIVFPTEDDLAGLSDHRNYWKFGYPAVMINDTSFLRNPHYHEITDTIHTLDFEKMKEVIDSSYNGIVNMKG